MQYVIITGVSGQLGGCLTKTLQAAGWYVIGLDVSAPEYTDFEDSFEFHCLDITDKDLVENFFKKLKQRDIRINGLVNNVGTAVFTPFENRTPEEINKVTATNINAPIYMVQGFLSVALPDYQSSIVNVASIYGLVAPDQALYSDTPRNSSEIYGMTKAATISFTQYLSVYLKEKKIRCNSIAPGGIYFKQGPEFIEKYSNKVPMNRMAREEEIASGIMFLLDAKRASYVNGTNLVVDGGFTAWR